MAKKSPVPAPLEERVFQSPDEIDFAIKKLERRITDLQALDMRTAVITENGADDVARSDVRATIREVFGMNSPEFREHQYLDIWAGSLSVNMSKGQVLRGRELGVVQTVGILNGLVKRLREKREDLTAGATPAPSTYFDRLNLHPRILEVSRERFLDGYPWDAVFAASKALVNYVKDRSGRHDFDGAPLMRTVFSRNAPLLAFNELKDQTDADEQEGMMHLFEGAVLGIRNPGGHSFPEGTDQRAIEYISLLSLLAYRVQEARKSK
jgi:uncharacterized protein (TIGR02391 family)